MGRMNENEDVISKCTDIKWQGRAHCSRCHIRQMMLFSELPESAFAHMLQPIDQYIYPPGAVLYEAGNHRQYIYTIRRGMVKLVHVTEGGSYRIVRLLGPGSSIGLEMLDGAAGYHHTAIALDQVDVCKIPVATVRQIESNHPTLCVHLAEQLQEQLDLADQWIVALGSGSARQRVARLILILEQFFADKNGEFLLISREDMAAMIGIAIETVSRMIAEFKREALLQKAGGKLYLCNTEQLKAIAHND